MQPYKENDVFNLNKVQARRPKSMTRYPKQMPSYIVAFAIQETYDDLATAQQMICNKKSSHSVNSTTANSSKIDNTAGKLTHIIDIPENPDPKGSQEINVEEAIVDETPLDNKESSETITYYIDEQLKKDNSQPQIIFNAKRNKKTKENFNTNKKKSKKHKRVYNVRNIRFKYKHPKNNISTKLERYYEKASRNSTSDQLGKELYSSSISQVISRSRILKKVISKENLLDTSDAMILSDIINLNEVENESITSSPSTAKRSIFSYSSQNTLTRKESETSKNDESSLKTMNSVVEVTAGAYKTDVINVAVAVTYKSSTGNNISKLEKTSSPEKLLFEETLTSTETIIDPAIPLTSESDGSSKNLKKTYFDTPNLKANEQSDETLVGNGKSSPDTVSDDYDTFVIAKTSSDFNRSSINSDYTLTSNSEITMESENLKPTRAFINKIDQNNFLSSKPTLLDTVIDIGMFPEITPSCSIAENYNNLNDVIITGDYIGTLTKNIKNKEDIAQSELSTNVFKKPFNSPRDVSPHKTINIPNETTIKEIMKESERLQKESCADEFRNNYPGNVSELWDKIIVVLDLAVKRLENNLSEKILSELQTSLSVFRCTNPMPTFCNNIGDTKTAQEVLSKKMSNKEISVDKVNFRTEIDQCLQCDIVQNNVIDQLMLKFSMEGTNSLIPGSSSKSFQFKRPKIFKDYLEILKPPAMDHSLIEEMVGKGDTITVSTEVPDVGVDEYESFSRLKTFFGNIGSFFRENMFVITSVPTFFVVLLCIYGIIVLVVKPW